MNLKKILTSKTARYAMIGVCAFGLGGLEYCHHSSAKSHIRVHRTTRKHLKHGTKIYLKKHNRYHKNKNRKTRSKKSNRRLGKIQNLKWYKGVPNELSKKSLWISDYMKNNQNASKALRTMNGDKTNSEKYVRFITPFSSKLGYNPTPNYYNAKHKHTGNGTAESLNATANPHFASLGKNYYLITAGSPDKNNKKSLKYELHNTLNHDFGSTVLVRINGINNISVWSYQQPHNLGNVSILAYKNNKIKGKKQFVGNYNRYPYNTNVALKALGANN